MRLRPLDAADRRAYLQEIRPRFLALRVSTGRFAFRWWLPAWAVEEPLRLVVNTAPLLARHAPRLLRRLPASLVRHLPTPRRAGAYAPWWHDLDALFSEQHRDLLALPDGAPLIDIATADAHIVIEQRRL